jgi:anaerobic ribonucleoside-triphosphate reductase
MREKKTAGEGVKFERIRRITGYLVGTVDKFNNAKKAEVNDRVKHGLTKEKERI